MASDSVQRLKSNSVISLKRALSAWSISAGVESSATPGFPSEDAVDGWFEAVRPTAWARASAERFLVLIGWYTQSMAFDRHRRQPFSSPEHLSYQEVNGLVSALSIELVGNVFVLMLMTRPKEHESLQDDREMVPVHTFLTRQFVHAFCTSGALRLCTIWFLTFKVSSPVAQSLTFKVVNMFNIGSVLI